MLIVRADDETIKGFEDLKGKKSAQSLTSNFGALATEAGAELVGTNGFDESMSGWGSEDKELCARLENAGIRRQTLLFAAIACHLAHPPASRSRAAQNRARWRDSVRSGLTRCELGLDQHAQAPPRA